VTAIEPGLSLHERNALMSPTVSSDPRFSMQIAYLAVADAGVLLELVAPAS
jgi:hypothetical protein